MCALGPPFDLGKRPLAQGWLRQGTALLRRSQLLFWMARKLITRELAASKPAQLRTHLGKANTLVLYYARAGLAYGRAPSVPRTEIWVRIPWSAPSPSSPD